MQNQFYVRQLAALTVLIVVATPTASKATDPRLLAYGRHLAQECTTCHRIDGVDNGIPSIVGLDPVLFAETIGFYRSGARPNAAMVSVAQSLDDEQIKALAAFYATLQKPAPRKSSGPTKAQKTAP